ncbi:MAG: pyruvate:ferredoxin (flavodoxin) oxidoreductase [Alphaproteobacteria bacterium]|nr:pyruvate:ferredoxin (flavodoxin) oxidoreductase [Alphaproteobacteria bacterium]
MKDKIKIFGGRYGLGSKEFKPRDVKAIVENMMRGTLRHNFTVGITDDVTGLSLATDSAFRIEPGTGNPRAALLYGIGSDGTVGAVKNIVKIVGDNSDLYPQSYAVYDSKKSGGLTASHLRFWDKPIQAQYLVESADFISVSNFMIAQRFDVFGALSPGGTVMINTHLAPDVAFANLPKEVQEHLIRNRAKVYFLDAGAAAHELGLGNRINTFIMLNFFNLTKIIDPKIAARDAKSAIEKTYKKKGGDVVAANWAAVDRAHEFLTEYKLPGAPSGFAPDWTPAMTADAPAAIAGTLGEIAAMRGNDLPVSAFKNFGEFPVGTSKYEKRNIADRVAAVDLNACIQCGKCSMLCPHAAIRMNALSKKQASLSGINFVPMKTPELGNDLAFNLSISAADCTGCQVCVKNCPVKALKMIPAQGADQTAFDAAAKLPPMPRDKLNLNIPKHIELCEHLFEFPGACAGCGETPYIKLVTQLFGDRMIVANATGCSSIYGGNLPTTPYTVNAAGRGPAWSNSLFEDNAEYGLGMRLALNQKQHALKNLLFELQNTEGLLKDTDIEKLFEEKDIEKQRLNVEKIKSEIRNQKSEIAANAASLVDALVDKSLWIIGGDGWAYDIGFGGLDHILHSGQNVNILVLDTEGYSNTGGQQSKATPFGASMKFSVGGKDSQKKDLGLIAMMTGCYVAQIAMGSNYQQTLNALLEAESYDGPSLVIAYAPCINHGLRIGMGRSIEQMKNAVDAGYWHTFRFDPRNADEGKNPLTIDSKAPTAGYNDFIMGEVRYSSLALAFPDRAKELFAAAEKEAAEKYEMLIKQQQMYEK